MMDSPAVVATCPIALLPCTACGHMPCPHCETSCDTMVELPIDEVAVASRRASIEIAPAGPAPALAGAAVVACAGCLAKTTFARIHARSAHEDARGWNKSAGYFCSDKCVEVWVHHREHDLCPCDEKGGCFYVDHGIQNAEAFRWFAETRRSLGMDKTGGSSGLDETGHILVYAPAKQEAG